VVVEGRVVVVGAARCVVVVLRGVVVVVTRNVLAVVIVPVVLVVVRAILVEVLAALEDGWLVHAAVVNATAVTAHTMWVNRRGRGVISPNPTGTWVRIPTPPSLKEKSA
jgi:hypothetical protein